MVINSYYVERANGVNCTVLAMLLLNKIGLGNFCSDFEISNTFMTSYEDLFCLLLPILRFSFTSQFQVLK